MAIRSKTELLALSASLFADNTSRAISEQDVRDFHQDLVDSLSIITNRGGFNPTGTDIYPSAGTGSGTSGAIQAGDRYYTTAAGDNTEYGGTMPIKTFFEALVNTPGSTASNWRIW